MTAQYRQLQAVYDSQAVTDGDGVKIQRSVTRGQLHTFDPFLLLDEIRSDDAADYIGSAEGSHCSLKAQQLGQLKNGNRVRLHNNAAGRFLLLAGAPLNEPIANWGPFVMNTPEQIEQAVEDYRHGRLV